MDEYPTCAVCQTPVTDDDRVVFEQGELIHEGCASAGTERESAA